MHKLKADFLLFDETALCCCSAAEKTTNPSTNYATPSSTSSALRCLNHLLAMSLFGQSKGFGTSSVFGQPQTSQQAPSQQTGSPFGQTMGGNQQRTGLGASIASPPQQSQQMPALSQSQAQLSSSLWQPGKETPRKFDRPMSTLVAKTDHQCRPKAHPRTNEARYRKMGSVEPQLRIQASFLQ